MNAGDNIIRRKIAAFAVSAAPPVGLVQALETALGKVAREMFDADAGFEGDPPGDGDLEKLLKSVPEPGLLMTLTAPDGKTALLCFDPLMVNALVELMTGAGLKQVFRTPRVPTLIDAALCRDFAAALCRQVAIESRVLPGAPVVPAFSLKGHETDAARLTYNLAAGQYGLFSGKVAFQGGARGGMILLALPLTALKASASAKPVGQWVALMAASVAAAPLGMRAVLDRVSMPIGRALDLKAGDLIPVPASALSDLALESVSGEVLFRGRLGQKDGRKAVCLTVNSLADPPDRSAMVPAPPKSTQGAFVGDDDAGPADEPEG